MLWRCYLHDTTFTPATLVADFIDAQASLLACMAGWTLSTESGAPSSHTVNRAAEFCRPPIILNGFEANKSLSAQKHIWYALGAMTSQHYSPYSARRDAVGTHD